ncbi:hypothetical protein PMAYCL1PPCAC_13868 [Pristionchus mayeri]|uniref:Uncharacterized protein n=1 Tax=Pristionchus mayeri TaxID=1317129 RepID=A0AAN4ZLZ3_9BILA|nr:hypothetical protein PMAYCL1PPCAC_13868 [Pristionchus mayeri]
MTNFILESGMDRIYLELSEEKIYSAIHEYLFTEDFIQKFSEQSNRCVLNVTNERKLIIWEIGLFQPLRPSADFLPIICRFEDLCLGLICLDTDHIIDLIMMRFQQPLESRVCWTFCISRDIKVTDIRRIDPNKYDVIVMDQRLWNITKKDTNVICNIVIVDQAHAIAFLAEFKRKQ